MTRSLRWRLYGLVRPVIRPIMHRIRTFMVGPLNDELRALRSEVQALRALIDRQPQAVETIVDQRARVIMGQALATLALDRELDRDQASEGLPVST